MESNCLVPKLGNRGQNRLSDLSRLATLFGRAGAQTQAVIGCHVSWAQENPKYYLTPQRGLDG